LPDYFKLQCGWTLKKIIGKGNNAAVFFELETKAPAEATVLVAEWHQVARYSAFDGRPYAAMFADVGTNAADRTTITD